LAHVLTGTSLGGRATELAGRSVLIATRDQYAAALALIELDGIARRLVVCTPDLSPEHLAAVVARADVDAIISDRDVHTTQRTTYNLQRTTETEWVLLTSGTTGAPKMAAHSFASLSAPVPDDEDTGVVWGTFYDIRRYGGLQILFRAMLGHGSFVMSSAGAPTGASLLRLGAHGATHVSGTPSHWRRVLMSPEANAISPRYIRLSGELADQGILNALHAAYPDAMVSHAFASTEAGVGFEVDDGLEGFPAGLLNGAGEVQLRVRDGSLRVRSARNALRILGEEPSALTDADGFVDTADMVERRGDRYYFLGRRSGVINVGGLKIHPEEVEATINRHPAVRMSMVRSKKSSITGALVTADVVLKDAGSSWPDGSNVDVQREILQICRDNLAPHKIPRTIRFVPALEIAGAGKLARRA